MPRLLSSLFALWFAVVLGDPGMLHSCAMHGGEHAGHGTAAAQHHMAGMAHEAPAEPQRDQAPPVCTCVGHCCATTAPAPLPLVATLELPALDVAHAAPNVVPAEIAPAAPDHLIPFANGPPAV
jgi:hypothetical protein